MPALLIHCSIGTVYCWSLVSDKISSEIGADLSSVAWAFSIAIFILGISAAFLGRIVEKDIKKSTFMAAAFFALGMAGTGFFITQKSLTGVFFAYGIVMGVGLGIGYIAPVKTLMLWFEKQKGLATGLAVAGFGLAKMIASPIMLWLEESVGVANMFYILAASYFFMMLLGHLLIKRPPNYVKPYDHKTNIFAGFMMFKNKVFTGIWLMFFINITCGLALIAHEKSIVNAIGLYSVVGIISSLTAVFNAGGRLFYSAWADKFKDRSRIFSIMLLLSVVFGLSVAVTNGIITQQSALVVVLLCVVNAGYGGGFSNVPALLADTFGMENLSQNLGTVLTAWAIGGIAGNQLAAFISANFGQMENGINPQAYQIIVWVIIGMYAAAWVIGKLMVAGKTSPEKSGSVN